MIRHHKIRTYLGMFFICLNSFIINRNSQTEKSARQCQYMGGIVTNSNRWAKVESNIIAVNFYFNSNSTYNIEAHAYSRGVALKYNLIGTAKIEYRTWNTLAVNYDIKIFSLNNGGVSIGSQHCELQYTQNWTGIDYDGYAWANNQPPARKIEGVRVVIDDNNNFGTKYNHSELAPNQWAYPFDCIAATTLWH